MKNVVFGSIALLLTGNLFAQPPHPDGPHKPPPPIAERWRRDSTKLQLYVVLNASQTAGAKEAFVAFYKEMDALLQLTANTPQAPPSREAVEKLRSKRSAALKAIFNAQQFGRFEVFEKEFMPPPPPKPQGPNEKV